MEPIDVFYSSVSDRRWFLGNPNINESFGFTWFIDASVASARCCEWNRSVSDFEMTYGKFAAPANLIGSPHSIIRA